KLRSWPPYFFGQVMPIQPRSPTRLLKPGTSLSPPCGLCGSKVPAAISSARKARTSLRSFSHSGGRRMGSKRRAAVMSDLDFRAREYPQASARRHQRPQFVGAARGDPSAEFHRPVTFVAEIVAPGQRAHGVAMQDVFERVADRAAVIAAAVSPASRARLCCTAWNFEIFFSNATRSFEYRTLMSSIDSSAPAICRLRATAPISISDV